MNPLSNKDLNRMKANIQNGIWIGIPACMFFLILGITISVFFFQDGLDSFRSFVGFCIGFGIASLGLFFAYIIVQAVKKQKAELLLGEKLVYSSPVLEKRDTRTKVVDDTGILFRRSQNITRWYITLEQGEFEVEKTIYDKFHVGDVVEVHLTPDTGLLLDMVFSPKK